MSAKWRRNRAWEDTHLTGLWLPLKWTLRVLSSITLAVILLVLVALYGVSASVPVGLLALAPTYLIYGLSLVVVVLILAALPAWLSAGAGASWPRAWRAGLVVLVLIAMTPVAGYFWYRFGWPFLRYDPVTHQGLRLFPAFVEEYRNLTVRRVPGLEMSELEYYSWWPLRLVLLLFVLNLVVATVRRIDFTVRNIGVLTVHTGIITIALGAVYYKGLKREGDTVLMAGSPDLSSGKITPGDPVDRFYDNTDVALIVSTGAGYEQRPLSGIPRYHEYGLDTSIGKSAADVAGYARPWADYPGRPLSLPVPGPADGHTDGFSMRVVGYAPHAEEYRDWVQASETDIDAQPLRIVTLYANIKPGERPDPGAPLDDGVLGEAHFAFTLPPASPAERASEQDAFSVEYTLGMSDQRWQDLTQPLPAETVHALIVEVPSRNFRATYPVQDGSTIAVGDTNYRIVVQQVLPQPPFPIITQGYKGATSSVAVVRVIPPGGEKDAFDRYVYHRFPEINQDMLAERNERGMPKRRDADPAIRISLIEADRVRAYLDEVAPGKLRAVVRQYGGGTHIYTPEETARLGYVPLVPRVKIKISESWDRAIRLGRAAPTPEADRDPKAVGTHDRAMLAIELAAGSTRRVVWLPFEKYWTAGSSGERTVQLPGVGPVTLAFSRLQHPLPGFVVRLTDFEMIAYDHRGAPRDYQSVVRVTPVGDAGFEQYDHVTKLNAPLRAPFMWDDDRRSWISNFVLTLAHGLSPGQFKFSQAGWDATGWERTQAQADRGELKAPFVRFTILGVGNNPGIHVIALGGVLMGLGIPWAFYLKPYLVRREKLRIQASLAAGTYRRPKATPEQAGGPTTEPATEPQEAAT